MIRRFFKRKDVSQPSTETVEKTPVEITPLFFVHIPKTAGTSFRIALEALQPMERDYGIIASETSALIKEHMYEVVHPFTLKQEMLKSPFALTGHVHIQKYADFFDINRIVTFVRDPIEQVISHYNHFVSHHGYQGDFAQFYRTVQFCNIQAKYLNSFPISLVGHVGITEHYEASLALMNDGLGLELPALKTNESQQASKVRTDLKSTEIEELTQLNQLDIHLYQQALEQHHQRVNLSAQDKPWAHIYAYINAQDVLVGCAFFHSSEETVNLILKINGAEQAMIVAQEFFGLFPKFNFPRQRYIGFSLPLSQWRDLGFDDLELMVTTTGQCHKIEMLTAVNQS